MSFSGWEDVKDDIPCRYCQNPKEIEYRIWDSSCGGYTDYYYHCKSCNEYWWIEGADA